MGVGRRIDDIERVIEKQFGDDVIHIKGVVVHEPGVREPTEAETKAAMEAYREKYSDGRIVVLTWDGENYVDE